MSNPEFIEDLEFAAESGVKFNGVLCGRATWKDGIPIFAEKGGAAFRAWLEDEGVKNIGNVNNALKAATPWYSIYEVPEAGGHKIGCNACEIEGARRCLRAFAFPTLQIQSAF